MLYHAVVHYHRQLYGVTAKLYCITAKLYRIDKWKEVKYFHNIVSTRCRQQVVPDSTKQIDSIEHGPAYKKEYNAIHIAQIHLHTCDNDTQYI